MGQSIVVTGSSSGLGRRISETLARQGHTVFAAMRNTQGRNAAAASSLADWAQQANLDLRAKAGQNGVVDSLFMIGGSNNPDLATRANTLPLREEFLNQVFRE